jgi:FAD synthetase
MFNKTQPAQKPVMAFGTFDLFHEGHEHFLKQAKTLGDFLIVIIARDKTVKQIKGDYPLNNERKRLAAIKKSGLADKVILGEHTDKYKAIRKLRPKTIALGYDQMVFTQKLNKILIDINLDARIERLDAFFPQVYKSSLLKKQMQENDICRIPAQSAVKSLS